jgi:uncharacterized membrane protein
MVVTLRERGRCSLVSAFWKWCMPQLGAMSLELMGQSRWWALVVGVTGVALLVYAWIAYRERKEEGAGRRLWVVAGSAGVLSLGVMAPLLFLPEASAQWAGLAWMVVVILAAVFLFYRRVYRALSVFRMGVLFGLRAVGLLALALLLFQPVLGFTETPTHRPRIAIVVDASGSMGFSDTVNEPNRFLQSAIAVEDTLSPRLEKSFDVQLFAYDGKHPAALGSSSELRSIAPDGQVTDLGAAVGMGIESGAGQVILFSDGIHNGAASVASEIAAMSVPVHMVRVGSSAVEPSWVPDIEVVSAEGPRTVTVNNQVTLTASIKSTAMSDRTIRVLLESEKGNKALDEQRLVLRSGPTPQTVKLKFTPEVVGRMVVKVRVPVDPGERSASNNEQDFALIVTDPKLAVLYVEGRVRPEVGPLMRVLAQDPNVDAVSMVQTQAGKFELRGTKEGDDLHGLPTTLAQWKRFKVVILGDLDASFLSPQQQRDLEQIVKDGAGLLMIGGQNSFAPGGWGRTTLADILPVELTAVTPPQINAKFVPELTAAGRVHPIFGGIGSYFIAPDGRAGSQEVPELSGCVAIAGAKAGASILAVHPTEKIAGAPAIVLAVQQYGKGRSAAFAADTTWHWNLFLRGMKENSPYSRFWGQMVRWLASQEELQKKNGPSVEALLAKEKYEAGEPVLLRAAVTDNEGQSTNYASVWADVTGPDGKVVHVPMSAVTDEGQVGTYEGKMQPKLSGTHQVVVAASKEGTALGKDAIAFTVLAAAGEMDVLAANPASLQEISRATGGSSVELSGVGALADRLIAELPTSAVAIRTTVPLYNNRGFFFLFVAALGTEWFLRRKWQLQ